MVSDKITVENSSLFIGGIVKDLMSRDSLKESLLYLNTALFIRLPRLASLAMFSMFFVFSFLFRGKGHNLRYDCYSNANFFLHLRGIPCSVLLLREAIFFERRFLRNPSRV